METSTLTPTNPCGDRAKCADERVALLGSLLQKLEEAAQNDGLADVTPDIHQSQLVKVRLGMASSLFTALRCKHPATANHSFRVALGVSAWGAARDLSEDYRDALEISALLHDVGKIGVPDSVLMNPGKLTADELLAMERSRLVGHEILSACCADSLIQDIMLNSGAWFDGSKHGYDRRGDKLPLGSRMLSIVDAFDSMTTDHIYRPALPRERALSELCEFAGTQFDPELVREFCDFISRDGGQLHGQVARRWLQELSPDHSNSQWTLHQPMLQHGVARRENVFQERLIESLCDGVVFVAADLKILRWNTAAERLTGIAATAAEGKQWTPGLVRLRDERDLPVPEQDCPAAFALRTGAQTLHRHSLVNRDNQRMPIHLQVAPVVGDSCEPHGAVLALHDASSQTTLEQRLLTLHEKAVRDPLTKVANRAEFNQVFPTFVETHLSSGQPCSLIICDIDHFKRINDNFGHQAGDDALTQFAAVLQRYARAGDLVARYGGEEFVVLCADCDDPTATRRAEEIRRRVAETPMASLNGQCITASFGVTEIQGGDTSETLLNRADRALLQAKDAGRNLVVQLGTGIGAIDAAPRTSLWQKLFGKGAGEVLLDRTLYTMVPLKVTAEKQRGFVADHHAQLTRIDEDRVTLTIDSQYVPLVRRTNDRPVPFQIELTLSEKQLAVAGRPNTTALRTLIHVSIRPKRQRDRRLKDSIERARQLLVSLKSYLMAQDYLIGESDHREELASAGLLRSSQRLLSTLLRK